MRHIFISLTEHKHRAVAKKGRVVRVLSWQGGELMSGSGAHNDDRGDDDGDEVVMMCLNTSSSMKAKKEPPHLTAVHP